MLHIVVLKLVTNNVNEETLTIGILSLKQGNCLVSLHLKN